MNNRQYWKDHFSSADSDIEQRFINLSLESCVEVLKIFDVSVKSAITFESAENRVFGFDEIVIKFYRPGRWSLDAIKQEVEFLNDLKLENISVVRPIGNVKTWKGIHYLAYEKVKKPFTQTPEILDEKSVRQMSHLLASIHKVGSKKKAISRSPFDPAGMCFGCFEVIQEAGFLPKEFNSRYEEVLNQITKGLSAFTDVPLQRVHGDSYSGNIVWNSEGPILLDFDDFQEGPTAIDVKLLSSSWRLDTLSESMDKKERRDIQQQLVLKHYREVNPFPESWEKMFPLLGAYRDIQFDAWFSSRWKDAGFAKSYSDDDITKKTWWADNLKWLEDLILST